MRFFQGPWAIQAGRLKINLLGASQFLPDRRFPETRPGPGSSRPANRSVSCLASQAREASRPACPCQGGGTPPASAVGGSRTRPNFCKCCPAPARISEDFPREVRADPVYAGVLTHNPVPPRWHPAWSQQGGYSLAELGQFIPPGWRLPRLAKCLSVEGRNTGLFRAGLRWCGLPRNWDQLPAVGAYLAAGEVKGIAGSVEKIARRNLLSGQTQATFSRLQAARSRKGGRIAGAKRHQGSNEAERPWAAAGMSRRTWYRRQAGQHTGRRSWPKKWH